MKAFLSFSNGHPWLSMQEKKIIGKLGEAAKIISSLYLVQKNPQHRGANFYPSDATKKEIELAAKKNPDILSPYTFVERKGAKLVAVPYRVKFKKELLKIAKLLKGAAVLSSDKNFQAYLKARAEDLLKDNYDRSNILWLKTERSKLSCVIGPFDRYLDKLFFKKRAYMAWIGVLDEEQTRDLEKFKAALLSSERKYLPGAKRVRVSKVKLRVEDTLLFAGLAADFKFTGNTLPSSGDLHLHEKYGSILTIFKPAINARFSTWIYPIFQKFFHQDIQNQYSEKELETIFLTSVVVHHACHSLMRYKDAVSRLEGQFPYFDELYTDLLGIKGCGSLVLTEAFTDRKLEILILLTVCHALFYYGSMRRNPHIEQFTQGNAIILAFLVEGKILQKDKTRFRIDFHRAFMAITKLASIVEYYMELGSQNEAQKFLQRFPIAKTFEGFRRYIPKNVS
jgi:hypothetical protein